MSDSVLRALGYGWSVGVCLVHKMSEKVFDSRNGEEDASFANEKASDSEPGPKTTEEISGHKMRSKTDPDLTRTEAAHSTIIHFDSLDETTHKSGLIKQRTSRGGLNKTDSRARLKAAEARTAADFRWNHFANGNTDQRWYHQERLDRSQVDLSGSRWGAGGNEASKYEPGQLGHKPHCFTTNSSESDIFPSRNFVSTNPNESTCPRPPPLFKSSSSSQLPCIRNNYLPASRPWRYGGNSTTRPISVVSMQQTFVPMSPSSLYMSSHQNYGKNCCGCCETSGRKNQNRAESVLSLADDPETPEGLSWRRLHMSRAKLKATATTSELLSGFAMVAMVELQINKPTDVPEWLFVMFAVCTTVLVSVHIFALMISTYLLPNIDAVSKLHVSSLVTESPHDKMKGFIELAWAFSTILGLFLFLVEIAILCWVKFWDYSFTAAMSATMIVIPVLVVFVAFAMHFYHSLVVIKCKTSVTNMQELENMKKQLDNVSPA